METSFKLVIQLIYNSDTLAFTYYFEGNAEDWITRPDTTYIYLLTVVHGDTTFSGKNKQGNDSSRTSKFMQLFEENIIVPAHRIFSNSPKWSISRIDKGKIANMKFPDATSVAVLCKDQKETSCDTLYIGGKVYNWFYVLNDSFDL